MAPPNGIGLGLRWDFLEHVLDGPPLDLAFLEVSPENYMRRGGYYPAALERLKERYTLVTHGLTLSLGASEPPPEEYLTDLLRETRRLGTPWHSDHLCFSTVGPLVLHDLLPLKLCQATVDRVSDRLRRVEDALKLPMAVEHISFYAHPARPEMPEVELINRILEKSQCGLLLDVNNVYVNAKNHGFDPEAFIASLDLDRVVELHVAGHAQWSSGLVVDTHGAPVCDAVMDLLAFTIERTGPKPVLLERDNDVPELSELLDEVRRLRQCYERGLQARGAAQRSEDPA